MANPGNKNLGVGIKIDVGAIHAELEQLKTMIQSTAKGLGVSLSQVSRDQVSAASQASREIIAIQKAQVTQALQTNKSMTAGGGFNWLTGGMDAGTRSQMAGFYKEQQRNIKEMASTANSAAAGIRSAFGGIGTIIGGAFAVSYLVRFGEQALAAMDKLNKMSQKVGVSTDTLQVYGHMAELAGTDIDGVSRALGIMSKHLVTAEMGGQDAYKALKSLDISAKDSNGTLKSSDQILIEVANKFKIMEDGTGKTALAMMLFGRTGKDMIPILNQGGQAIQEMHERMEKLGVLINQDTIQAATAFNEHLKELGMMTKGLAMRVMGELSPALNNLVTAFLDSDSTGQQLKSTAEAIATVIKGLAVTVIGAVAAFDLVGSTIGGFVAWTNTLGTDSKNSLDDFGVSLEDLGIKATKTSIALAATKNPSVLEGLDAKLQYYGNIINAFWKNTESTVKAALKTYSPDFDSEKMSKQWEKMKESLQLDMDKLGLTEFEKKLGEIIHKAQEMGREFAKVPGATGFIGQWSARMTMAVSETEREALTKEANERLLKLRQDYVKEEEKYQKYITDATGTELQRRVTEEEKTAQDMVLLQNKYLIEGLMDLETFLKKEEEIRGASKERIQKFTTEYNLKLREDETKHQLNLVDVAEQNRFISKPEAIAERIRLNNQLLKDYEAELGKIQDPVAWHTHMAAIDGVRARLLDLKKQMRDYTGSVMEGFKEGLQRYADANSGMFKNMADAGEQCAKAMESGFATFLDYTSDKFLNFRNLAVSLLHDVYMALVRAMIVQPLVSGIAGLFGGGLLSSISVAMLAHQGGYIPRLHSGGMSPDERLVINRVGERYVTKEQNDWLTSIAKNTGGQSNLSVKVELINKSDQKLAAQTGTPRFNAQEVIIPVVIDAIDRNVMGLRTMLGR
jgi:hypothetical protein